MTFNPGIYKIINRTRLYRTNREYYGSDISPDLTYGELVACFDDDELLKKILGSRYKHKQHSYVVVYSIKTMEKGIVKKHSLHKNI